MNIKRVEEIQDLIKKAEIELAKAEGQIQTLEDQWKKTYGTGDINEIKKIQNNLKSELLKTQERLNLLYNELLNSCDWDSLEEELS